MPFWEVMRLNYVFLENANYDWMEMLNFHQRPFRAKVVPSKIWKDLDLYRNDAKGLSNYFKKWRTRIEFCPQKSKSKLYETYIAVGGEYEPDDRQCSIQLYNTNFDKFNFTDDSWNKLKYKLIQTLMHELIHFMQFDRRGDEWSGYIVPYKKVKHEKKNMERKYLSEFDEIQAYAHCVLLDFKTYRPIIPTETLINRAKNFNDSGTLRYILKAFDYDYRNVAIPKLMHQIVKWDRKYQRTIRASRRPK
jgi:hypothetical protein